MNASIRQRRAIQGLTRGILQHRPRLLVIAGLSTMAMLAGLGISAVSPVLDGIDRLILYGLLVAFAAGTAGLYLLPRRRLYALLSGWVGLVFLAITGMLANAMFGSHTYRLLDSAQPYVALYVPIAVLFAYTYLETRTATLQTVIFSVVSSSLVLAFAFLHRQQIGDWTAIVLLLGTTSILPLHVALLAWIHQRIQASAVHQQANRRLSAWREHERLQELEKLDPVTGGLNERGIHAALHADAARGLPLYLGVAKIKDFDELQRRMDENSATDLLRHLAAFVSYAFGKDTRWGLDSDNQFVFWSQQLEPEEFEQAMEQLQQRIAESTGKWEPGHDIYFGRAVARPQDVQLHAADAEMLLHDAELDLFKSMIGGFISEQT